jgi:hypothetical protein
MFDTAIWLFEVCSALALNHQQAFCETQSMLSANTIKTFASGFRNSMVKRYHPYAWLVDRPFLFLICRHTSSVFLPFYHNLTSMLCDPRPARHWESVVGRRVRSREDPRYLRARP